MSVVLHEAVAVTGRGVLTPLGDSPPALHTALCEGRSALGPSADFGGVAVASIADFEATKYANVRGLRMYNRTTRLAICSARLALTEAGIDPATFPPEDLGLLMASTYGHMDVLLEYDRSLVANGVQRTNGALMPLAIPSAPGAMVALAFGARAFSMTLSDGGASSLDALGLAARWLAEGRARACIVVTSFSAAPDVIRVMARAELLAPGGKVKPFDKNASGTGIGEATVAFVLEREVDAAARGAASFGTIRGYAATFAPKPGDRAQALRRACGGALAASGATVAELTLVSAGASGVAAFDRAEGEGLKGLLGADAQRVAILGVKGALGETLDAAGALQALTALSGFESSTLPRVVGLDEPEIKGLRYVTKEESMSPGTALITSQARDGGCAALVVSAPRARGAS